METRWRSMTPQRLGLFGETRPAGGIFTVRMHRLGLALLAREARRRRALRALLRVRKYDRATMRKAPTATLMLRSAHSARLEARGWLLTCFAVRELIQGDAPTP